MSNAEAYVWDWWENPDRKCLDDERYEDLTYVLTPRNRGPMAGRGLSRKAQIEQMCQACMVCPVYYECLQDLLKFPMNTFYGVRAGKKGLT